MHNKRDRQVALYLHRASENLLLFPYVYFMGGQAAGAGDAVELAAPVAPTLVAKEVARLLRVAQKADIDEMKRRRMEELRSYWRNSAAPSTAQPGVVWNALLARYPALAKGPSVYLRQFAVANLVERDSWNHRKLVRIEPSPYRGCTTEGEVTRLLLALTPKELGLQLLSFLLAPQRV